MHKRLDQDWYGEEKRKKRGILREKSEVHADRPSGILNEQTKNSCWVRRGQSKAEKAKERNNDTWNGDIAAETAQNYRLRYTQTGYLVSFTIR